LYLSGDYSQKEIDQKVEISEQTIVQLVKELPACRLSRIKVNLFRELEKLSKKPKGNEELIFKYIEHLSLLDDIIKKSTCLLP